MQANHIILSRGLPKTGQEVEYAVGDDGTHEAGWWVGRKIADNRERFISKTIEGGAVVIDRATGLMWIADAEEEVLEERDDYEWEECLDFIADIDFAGFTDWRMPNIFELMSIFRCNAATYYYYDDYFSNYRETFWSSTTLPKYTMDAFTMDFRSGLLSSSDKVEDTHSFIAVRGGL